MSQAQIIKQKVSQNTQILDIFSTEQLIEAWEKKTGKEISQIAANLAREGANYVSPTLDSVTALKLLKDIGATGRIKLKNVGNKQYVIFKGLAGNRSIFNGTRYLATNPKVVDMAIGRIGKTKSMLSGARLTIFLIVPLNVLNYLLNDQHTMSYLIGKTATDIAKVGIASALAALVGTSVAAVTTIAAGPIIAAIAVGVAAGLGLDYLDKQFGITDALVKAMDEAYDSTVGEMGRQLNRVERHLKWQMLNGLPVGRGIFY